MAESGVQKLAGVTIRPGSVAMALWSGLGNVATVAQLVGKGDAGGLIAMIIRAAATARQNRRECEQLARRVLMIAELLPHLEHLPEAASRSLAGLDETLREAHELVVSCQGRSVAYQFVLARRQADKFRELHGRIDSYLIVFPVVSYIGITRRLDQIYSILVPGHRPCLPSSPPLPGPQPQLQDIDPDGVGAEEFTLAEMATVTSNFAPEAKIGEGGSGIVYRGRLRDGREVAVKRLTRNAYRDHEDAFRTELFVLPTLRHDHIIPLLGGCSEEEEERLLVYEYMSNGSLHDHLHKQPAPLTSCSPVTMSWRARVEVLLGVSRAVEHLHGHAAPIIHRDIKPSNILLDASWAPRLADFGLSLAWDPREAARVHPVVGTYGYADTEYLCTGRLSPASDVYNFGMVMLEVLTGRTADSQVVNRAGERWVPEDSVSFALRFIEAGELEEVLDRRPSAEPASQQLKALELLAHTAARCVRLRGTDRPPIQDVVASLQAALDIMSQA